MGAGLYKMVHEGSSPHGPGMVHEGSSWSLMSSIGPSPIRALALEMTAGDSEFSALLVALELPNTMCLCACIGRGRGVKAGLPEMAEVTSATCNFPRDVATLSTELAC